MLLGGVVGTFLGFTLGALWVMTILDTAEKDIIRQIYKERGQKLRE